MASSGYVRLNAVTGPRTAHGTGRFNSVSGSGTWSGVGPSGVCYGVGTPIALTLALLSRVNPNFRFWPVAVVLVGCCENSQEEAELEAIADAMDAYDTMARLAPLLI